jgi:hypothetical protein
MKRQEAVRVVKELCTSCGTLNTTAIDLKQSDLGTGHYEIHVKGAFDNKIWQSLKSIAKKHSLGIKLTDQSLMIYKQESKRNEKFVHF